MTPKRGDILTTNFSCSLWSADGTVEIDTLQSGEVLLVISSSPPELGMWYQPPLHSSQSPSLQTSDLNQGDYRLGSH